MITTTFNTFFNITGQQIHDHLEWVHDYNLELDDAERIIEFAEISIHKAINESLAPYRLFMLGNGEILANVGDVIPDFADDFKEKLAEKIFEAISPFVSEADYLDKPVTA